MKTKLLLICCALVFAGCVPNVTYKGKYGEYTATPSGVVILPYYAIQSDK